MSSFLGSSDPTGGFVVLARNVTINPGTTTPQAIYTAGSQRAVPLYFVLRAGATALSSTTSYKVGVTGALTALVNTTVATSLPTGASNCQVVSCLTSGATTAVTVAPGASVYFTGVQVDPTVTASTCDLIGYLA